MKWRVPTLLGIVVFLVQYFLSEYLTIRSVRPDFLLIFVSYVAIRYGSTAGVVYGFVFGLLQDLPFEGSLAGLAPLTKSITGFLMGRLCGKYPRMNPLVFHVIWISIVVLHFVVYAYVSFQSMYESSQARFWMTCFFLALYTLLFMAIAQIIKPLHQLRPPE